MPRRRVPYAELHAHSAYSFLDGASLPSELVERACELELDALALTDHDGFPGVVQLAEAARTAGLPVAVGTELSLAQQGVRMGQADPQAEHLLILARHAQGYRTLSRTIGKAMLASGRKGEAHYTLEGLAEAAGNDWMVLTGCRKGAVCRALESSPGVWAPERAARELDRLIDAFGRDNVVMELTASGSPLDRERCILLSELAEKGGVEAIVTGNVHYARATDRPVADVLAATRARMTLPEINPYLPASGQYLRSGAQMREIHREHPRAVEAAARLARECVFDLVLVAPELPPFPVPQGHTEGTWLRQLTHERALQRYGNRQKNPEAWKIIDHELEVISGLGFPGYFLIVEEIVSFCAQKGIWCQGRGSAANSAVCFALGITAVDAVQHKMLFERFLSADRVGPPDIDLDIESGRREEVIQHVYHRYGRECAAQVANTITYRPRSAIRDAARAFGYDQGQADQWSEGVEHRVPRTKGRTPDPTNELHATQGKEFVARHGRAAGFAKNWETGAIPDDVAHVAARLQKLPRHLGIHSGGMVLCDRPVIDVCPVGWANMPDRTVLQWDKEDCAEAGLVKFDLLGLGMLTALRIAFTFLTERGILGADGKPLSLHNLPQEDPGVYKLLQAADTVGVFQVESRAQMATLPRLHPEEFYDIVVEVALIRPGPIQGQSVNPYLQRRREVRRGKKKEEFDYPHELLRPALEKTLGVPLFQEQLMQIAIDAAGFTPSDADKLRKAMGSKRSHERMEELREDLLAGMAEHGIAREVAEGIYEKLQAFAEFGFPESHAFSFAYLVYASAWLKVHHPEEFYAGLLAAQPMGFYSPQSLVADARLHGVLVLPPDVMSSQEEAAVEQREEREVTPHPLVHTDSARAVRLGLSAIRGLGEAGTRILRAREEGAFKNAADLSYRAQLSRQDIEALSSAGALESLGTGRREGIWLAHALEDRGILRGMWYQPTIPGTEAVGESPPLAAMSEAESTDVDIRMTGVSTSAYPTQFLRPELDKRHVLRIAELGEVLEGERVFVAGVVTHRQRPHTAQGITFISLEDETGLLNVMCSQGLWSRYRDVARRSQGLIIRGMVERGDGAMNFVADQLEKLSFNVSLRSRDFR
ncbi:error-prone DNA polymerase [Actinomycetaceae bacterium L2_0104]